jgi:glycerol uptake facilitator-like aquaporin
VLMAVLVGFTLAFWILSKNDPSSLFNNINNAFLNTFMFMLGQMITTDFAGSASPSFFIFLLILFMMFMMLLMLNLLIALMG